jgi:leader peptidase (prepilin peptidase)/N-methyltransferase
VPVLSWLIERGRCRHCRAAISPRYLVIELVTAAGVTAAFLVFGFTAQTVLAVIGVVAFVALATINIERQKDV